LVIETSLHYDARSEKHQKKFLVNVANLAANQNGHESAILLLGV